jgi:hypothetical protein
MKTKPRWTKEIPIEEGWYWFKYYGKNGFTICPAKVMLFETNGKLSFSVRTAYNDVLNSNNIKEFGSFKFGPAITFPK